MHQIHPDTSLVPMLKRIVAGGVNYHLFTNNITVDRDTVLGDFVEPVPGSAYSPITVDDADFALTGVATHRGSIIAPMIEFVPIGDYGESIYGYYATDSTDTDLLACANFDDAPIPWATGSSVPVLPIFGDTSRFAS